MKVVNIKWDIDAEDIENGVNLPTTVEVPAEIATDPDYADSEMKDALYDHISDWLSDTYGYCHSGFDIVESKPVSNVKNIVNKILEGVSVREALMQATIKDPSTGKYSDIEFENPWDKGKNNVSYKKTVKSVINKCASGIAKAFAEYFNCKASVINVVSENEESLDIWNISYRIKLSSFADAPDLSIEIKGGYGPYSIDDCSYKNCEDRNHLVFIPYPNFRIVSVLNDGSDITYKALKHCNLDLDGDIWQDAITGEIDISDSDIESVTKKAYISWGKNSGVFDDISCICSFVADS